MKKTIAFFVIAILLSALLYGCGGGDEGIKRVDDLRNITDFEFTYANISSTDKEGRIVRTGDMKNDNYVGLFYHVWLGYHTKNYGKNLNLTEIMAENPNYLRADYLGENSNLFHYWGEPLYGYYCSDDPWVITRHVELLTMIGVDYLVYDLTNAVIYYDAINAIFEVLQRFYEQGFKVPKVAFYTNTHSAATIANCYNTWYKNGLYQDLWFSFGEKPLIIGVSNELSQAQKDLFFEFFDFRESQWPYGRDADYEKGFPWMDWEYPQKNYNGTVSVSLAQHPGARMSEGAMSNRGRGFDYEKYKNYPKNADLGTNFAGQWKTVFENNADLTKKKINNVFITGFNEWIAMKLNDGENSFFVDTFSREYSRDIEMMKGGYLDNYYLQAAQFIKEYKYTQPKRYKYNLKSIDIKDTTFSAWEGVRAYKDFAGDTLARNFRDAGNTTVYTDNSGRNDITDVKIIHDENNLYVLVQTVDDITPYNGTDTNWMNLLIKVDEDIANTFGGYRYMINRSPKSDGTTTVHEYSNGQWKLKASANYFVYGNKIVYSIPLSALGLSKDNCYLQLKAADNVPDNNDIATYYIYGDSAPIGRLSYTYGY